MQVSFTANQVLYVRPSISPSTTPAFGISGDSVGWPPETLEGIVQRLQTPKHVASFQLVCKQWLQAASGLLCMTLHSVHVQSVYAHTNVQSQPHGITAAGIA